MHHTIILRTVCGCEQQRAIPDRNLPPIYRVHFRRGKNFCMQSDELDLAATITTSVRTFERTPLTGQYGYPVYLEVVE